MLYPEFPTRMLFPEPHRSRYVRHRLRQLSQQRTVFEQNRRSKTLPSGPSDPFTRAAVSEPGVDATQAWTHHLYSHIHEDCIIRVVDYSSDNVNTQKMDNHSFLQFLRQAPRHHSGDVRWIDVTVSVAPKPL